MKVADYLAQLLVKNKIDTVFGIPSYVGMQLLGAFNKAGMSIELSAHEQNAAHMAEGYFYATGKPAVVSVAIGPGLSNAMTGIANAYIESVPMIVVAARASAKMLGRNEYHANTGIGRTLNERQMIASCTKAAYYLNSVEDAKSMLTKAVSTAISGRPGPVYISIPPELQMVELGELAVSLVMKETEDFSKTGVDEAKLLWDQSQNPLIMLGKDIRQMDKELLRSFLQDNVPYFTSYGAKGYVPLLPNYLGTAWYCNSEQTMAAIRQADLVLALGEDFTHFTIRIFDEYEYEIKKPIIQVHEYQEELDRTFKSKVAIHMQVSDFIAEAKLSKKQWPSQELQLVQKERVKSGDEYSALWCIQNLSRVLPANAVFFGDVGNAGYASITDLQISSDQSYFTTGKFGVCGWSIPTSIGYAYGQKSSPTFTIIGDLSMNMNGNELANVNKYGVRSNFIVFNNGKPQNISIDQGIELGGEVQSKLPVIGWESYAQAYGLQFVGVKSQEEFESLKNLDFDSKNYLIEVVVGTADNPLRE